MSYTKVGSISIQMYIGVGKLTTLTVKLSDNLARKYFSSLTSVYLCKGPHSILGKDSIRNLVQ